MIRSKQELVLRVVCIGFEKAHHVDLMQLGTQSTLSTNARCTDPLTACTCILGRALTLEQKMPQQRTPRLLQVPKEFTKFQNAPKLSRLQEVPRSSTEFQDVLILHLDTFGFSEKQALVTQLGLPKSHLVSIGHISLNRATLKSETSRISSSQVPVLDTAGMHQRLLFVC